MSTRWKVVLAYHGGAYVGWQVQPNGPSIQSTVEDALARLLGEGVSLSGSGRTDAGVHAYGQVASFVTTVDRSARSVRDGLNAHLPADIACVSAEEVPPDFDPRRWTRRKTYRYQWLDRRARSPLHHDRAWHVRRRLDDDAMREAAQHLVGRHDFSAFRAVGCSAAHAERVLLAARVARTEGLLRFEVEGNGFLRHMVRILAGTLTEVGRGKRPVTWMREVLRSGDRTQAGQTAPAHGLSLVCVEYGDGPPEWATPT